MVFQEICRCKCGVDLFALGWQWPSFLPILISAYHLSLSSIDHHLSFYLSSIHLSSNLSTQLSFYHLSFLGDAGGWTLSLTHAEHMLSPRATPPACLPLSPKTVMEALKEANAISLSACRRGWPMRSRWKSLGGFPSWVKWQSLSTRNFKRENFFKEAISFLPCLPSFTPCLIFLEAWNLEVVQPSLTLRWQVWVQSQCN
jgi:hypothetical protein